jgi:hypothetical protein
MYASTIRLFFVQDKKLNPNFYLNFIKLIRCDQLKNKSSRRVPKQTRFIF